MADDTVLLRVWVFGDLHFEPPSAPRVKVKPAGSGPVTVEDMLRERNSAIQSLAEQCKDAEAPHALVSLGDVGDSASDEGLVRGLDYLHNVAGMFAQRPEVMVLPGNHDIRVLSTYGGAKKASPFHPGSQAFYKACAARRFATPDRPRSWPKSDAYLLCPLDATRWVGAELGDEVGPSASRGTRRSAAVPAVPRHWAPGVLQQDMRDFVTKAVDRLNRTRKKLVLGFMHQPITSHAGEDLSPDLIDGFVAGGIVRRWLMETGFSALFCGHRHESGATLESPLQLPRSAFGRPLAMLTLPAHVHPDYPVLVCEILVGGRIRTASLRTRLARKRGDSYGRDYFCAATRLPAASVPVWEARFRKMVCIDSFGEAAVSVVMEGLGWQGAFSPYVDQNRFDLERKFPALARYERAASLKFHLSWEHGAAVVEPKVEIVGSTKAESWIRWDVGESFEVQRRDSLSGKIIVATDGTDPVDLAFRCRVSNAYATTYQELLWLEGREKAANAPREYEKDWQHVNRQCDLLDMEVQLPREGDAIADISKVTLSSEDPCVEENGRKVLDWGGRRILASIRHPVPSADYRLLWEYGPRVLPDPRRGRTPKGEQYRRRLLEARGDIRAETLGLVAGRRAMQPFAKLVRDWVSGILTTWETFTEVPSKALDVSVMVPTLPTDSGTPFNPRFLAKVASDHHRIAKDLRDYELPPLRLITVAGNVPKKVFWDTVYFSFGEGLAGQAFRRNRILYRDGFNPSTADRLYKPLPRQLGKHHSLFVFPVDIKSARFPIFILNVGVLDRAADVSVLASKLAVSGDEDRAALIRATGERLKLSGRDMLKKLLDAG